MSWMTSMNALNGKKSQHTCITLRPFDVWLSQRQMFERSLEVLLYLSETCRFYS